MQKILATFVLTLAVCTLGACDKSGGETTPPEEHAAGHDEHHAEGEEHDHGDVEGKDVVAAGEATIGDVTSCPVSGETFVVTEDSPHLDHEGKTYYFCCANCKAKAEAEPEKFLSAAPE